MARRTEDTRNRKRGSGQQTNKRCKKPVKHTVVRTRVLCGGADTNGMEGGCAPLVVQCSGGHFGSCESERRHRTTPSHGAAAAHACL